MSDLPFSPAAERNLLPIAKQLQALLPAQGVALEIASGTGQHALGFASHLPGWTWLPTEADPRLLDAINARRQATGLPERVRPAMALDVAAWPWPLGTQQDPARFDLIFCANLLHIAPWPVCAALMRGAAQHLATGGVLITYGPYLEQGVPTSPGNLAFDASLRESNPAWGLRVLVEVAHEAQQTDLALRERHAMPANNLLLVWARAPATS